VNDSGFDPVDLAITSSRFTAIVRKMSNTLLRAGRSVILNTGRDFSCCVVTGDDQMLSMAESIPVHVLCGPDLMARSMRELHPNLRPGDAFLHNSPYHGNSHPADLSILVPVFDEDERHRFTIVSKAHVADIGNAEPTAYSATARDVYEEGAVIFPCVKVQTNYTDIDDVIRMCRVRIRVPDMWWGDYLALLGSARVGERELRELASETGWDRLDDFVRAWFDYSEGRMADAIARLPEGEVVATTHHDPFEQVPNGIPVKVSVRVAAGYIDVDLTDNVDCQPCGLNTTESTARSAAMLGVFNALDGVAPANAGSFRRLRVHLRENCVVGIPRHPASCSVATCNLVDRIGNCVQRALAELAEGFGLAEVGYSTPASVGVFSGVDPRIGGVPFIDQLVLGWTGGPGGPVADGWLTMAGIGDAGVLQRDSVELDELRFPVRIETHRVIPDTEGAGWRRGAPAAEASITSTDTDITVVYLSDGTINPPAGARGGGPGSAAWQGVRSAEGEIVDAGVCARLLIRPGETLLSHCNGGGGYGDPLLREPERVLADVAEGYVSRERARSVYGVAIDGDLVVDAAATDAARRRLASAREERS
jgi:N-methylhydantoinase B